MNGIYMLKKLGFSCAKTFLWENTEHELTLFCMAFKNFNKIAFDSTRIGIESCSGTFEQLT